MTSSACLGSVPSGGEAVTMYHNPDKTRSSGNQGVALPWAHYPRLHGGQGRSDAGYFAGISESSTQLEVVRTSGCAMRRSLMFVCTPRHKHTNPPTHPPNQPRTDILAHLHTRRAADSHTLGTHNDNDNDTLRKGQKSVEAVVPCAHGKVGN